MGLIPQVVPVAPTSALSASSIVVGSSTTLTCPLPTRPAARHRAVERCTRNQRHSDRHAGGGGYRYLYTDVLKRHRTFASNFRNLDRYCQAKFRRRAAPSISWRC